MSNTTPRARKAKPATKTPGTRQRLSAQEREQQILDSAIAFFSKRGLDGQTRDLAREIGITHPLLYHYFPTKKALIERVYQQVYLGRWKPQWEEWLDDDSLDLEKKLVLFYQDYACSVMTPEWVRILIFSGLSDGYIPDKYLSMLKTKLFPRIVRETRRHLGIDDESPATEREIQLVWGLHGGVFYMGIQQWVYQLPTPAEIEPIISDRVKAYVAGAFALFAPHAGAATARRTAGAGPKRPSAQT